jgi:hypothetical protein
MDAPTIARADILALVIAFVILGVLLIGFGWWGRDRVDSLLVDTRMGDRLDDDEHEYRASMLQRGVASMFIVGGILVAAAIGLYVFAV